MWLQEPDHTSFCDVYRSVVCSVTHVLVEILKGIVCVYSSESECVCVCVCVCVQIMLGDQPSLWLPHLFPFCLVGAGDRGSADGSTCWWPPPPFTHDSFSYLTVWFLCSLIQSYLLLKSLSPVKDLEQPLSVSLSSSTQIGGAAEKAGGKVEEDGREELEEEDAELNSS